MDFEIINSLLEPGGFMVFKSFPSSDSKDFLSLMDEEKREIFKHYFTQIPDADFDPNNYNIYQKIETGGRRNKFKKTIKNAI
jgi:hypothetical protein